MAIHRFISCICLSLGFLSAPSLANDFKDCLDSHLIGLSTPEERVNDAAAKVFWTSVLREKWQGGRSLRAPHGNDYYLESTDLATDASSLDRAVMALTRGESYGATSAFQRVYRSWNEFVPMLQERVKRLSKEQVELRPFIREEEKAIGAESDARYFKLIRHFSHHSFKALKGPEEEVAKLTQEGIIILSSSELSAPKKTHGFVSQGSTTGHPAFLSSSTLVGVGGSPLERNVEREAHHLDSAVKALIQGESYGVAKLKNKPIEVKNARAAFDRLYQGWDMLLSSFKDRLKVLSDGKSELVPISAREAGVAVVGYGRYFKLVQQTDRGTETHVVELTSEGFSVLPPVHRKP